MDGYARALVPLMAVALAGCSGTVPIQLGDRATEQRLKQLDPVAGKASIYVCWENVERPLLANRATLVVDERTVAGLKPNSFTHALLDPGAHRIRLRVGGRETGAMNVDARAGDVKIYWAGWTGGGWGTLNVDDFSSAQEARACVQGAEYVIEAK